MTSTELAGRPDSGVGFLPVLFAVCRLHRHRHAVGRLRSAGCTATSLSAVEDPRTWLTLSEATAAVAAVPSPRLPCIPRSHCISRQKERMPVIAHSAPAPHQTASAATATGSGRALPTVLLIVTAILLSAAPTASLATCPAGCAPLADIQFTASIDTILLQYPQLGSLPVVARHSPVRSLPYYIPS